MNRIHTYYALYHADKILTIGTIEELANYLGVQKRTIKFYSTPTHLKRTKYKSYVVIKIEEDKENE